MNHRVRRATPTDAEACAAVYAPYVTGTAVTFESVPPTPADMSMRIKEAQRAYDWFVLEDDGGTVVGYAYAGPYKERPAYRWSCEVSVYLQPGRHRRGGGRALYQALFASLLARGYRTVVAGMTLPNDASAGLHAGLGFELVGTYRRIGWKNGAWHDVAWLQMPLRTGEDPPADPV